MAQTQWGKGAGSLGATLGTERNIPRSSSLGKEILDCYFNRLLPLQGPARLALLKLFTKFLFA